MDEGGGKTKGRTVWRLREKGWERIRKGKRRVMKIGS